MGQLPWRGLDRAGDDLVIREATRRDAARFLEHMEAIVTETDRLLQSALDPLPDLTTQQAIIEQFDRLSNCLALVAHRPGPGPGRAEIVGSLTLLGGTTRRTRHVSKLGMGVRREAWGRGIGRQLVDSALGWAKRNETVERLALQVYASNTTALSLYRSSGFEEDGRLLDEVSLADGMEDLITMSRSTEDP